MREEITEIEIAAASYRVQCETLGCSWSKRMPTLGRARRIGQEHEENEGHSVFVIVDL